MPAYQCGDCEEVFTSKSALRTHKEDCSPTTKTADTVYEDMKNYVSNVNFKRPRIKGKLTMQNLGIAFGVLMMATLFAGTASFMSTTAPAQSPTGAVTAESNPALGYSIRNEQDVRKLSNAKRPQTISNEPLTKKQQLWAITQGGQQGRPAAIIHYNCETQCPELVDELTTFAENYPGWIYVAPNPEISSRVVVTGFQNIQRYSGFEQQQMKNFVCSVLQNQPISCVA